MFYFFLHYLKTDKNLKNKNSFSQQFTSGDPLLKHCTVGNNTDIDISCQVGIQSECQFSQVAQLKWFW